MGKWTECMCEASKPFHALEHLFLLCRGFSAFWPAGFSISSRPVVIFRLIIFRLVRHDHFIFFHLCLLSLSVLDLFSKAIMMKVQRLPPSARRPAQQE